MCMGTTSKRVIQNKKLNSTLETRDFLFSERELGDSYFASNANANMPAASGAAADVPE